LIAGLLLLQGCLKTDKERTLSNGGVALDGASVTKTFVGNTLTGQVSASGYQVPYVMYVDPSGRIIGTAGGDNDRGTWRVDDQGELCLSWSRWQEAKEHCSVYFHEGDQFKTFVKEGGISSVSKVEPGNSHNLSAKTDLEVALAKQITPLTAADARAQLIGNTFSGTFKPLSDAPIQTFYSPDGKVAAHLGGMANQNDTGAFHIDDEGQVCVRWTKWNDAKEGCSKLYREGDKLEQFTPTGSLGVVGTIVKGNSEKLTL
jgi:hypothetical protein